MRPNNEAEVDGVQADRGEGTRSGHFQALLSKTRKPYLQMKPALLLRVFQ